MVYLLDAFLEGFTVDHAWSEGIGNLTALGADIIGGSGIRGQLTMFFDAPVSEWVLSVVCDRGVAVIDLFRDIQFVIPPDGGHRPFQILRSSVAGMLGHGFGTVNTGARYLARRQFWGHDVIIAEFLAAVREDKDPPVTGEDGARVVSKMIEILDAAGV
jgi:hypothetical protein